MKSNGHKSAQDISNESKGDLLVSGLSLTYGNQPVLKDVSLEVSAGQTLVLLGPSGCGKTSLLRAIAGLEAPMTGTISVGGRILLNSTINLKPERRQVGMVFQDLALFPHLTVGGNVAYGLPKKNDRDSLVAEALALVNLEGFESRRISTLSGGQQQRVALARALAPKPKVLLLDEPFASLDEPTRVELRGQVHELLAGLKTTAIFVTHDQEEAFILGDQVSVMSTGGNIEQQDTPANLYRRPVNRWVADFVGSANLLRGVSNGTDAKTCLGAIPLLDPVPPADTQIDVLIRPEGLQIIPHNDEASTSGKIKLVEYYGHDILYLVNLDTIKNPASHNVCDLPLWVRAVTNYPEYARESKVGLKYIGPPALSFPISTSDETSLEISEKVDSAIN